MLPETRTYTARTTYNAWGRVIPYTADKTGNIELPFGHAIDRDDFVNMRHAQAKGVAGERWINMHGAKFVGVNSRLASLAVAQEVQDHRHAVPQRSGRGGEGVHDLVLLEGRLEAETRRDGLALWD
jgi:hypothetical protein